jgi:hypothetical protein
LKSTLSIELQDVMVMTEWLVFDDGANRFAATATQVALGDFSQAATMRRSRLLQSWRGSKEG